MSKRTTELVFVSAILVIGSFAAAAQTADNILDQTENVFSLDEGGARGVLTSMTIRNEYTGGVTSEFTLAVFELTDVDPSKPEESNETTYALMVFLGGDEGGSMLLLRSSEDDAEKSRMWLFLPALGVTKALISDEEQGGSFAGSSFSYADLGGTRDLRSDYTASILREETLDIGSESFDVWVLELLAKPDTDAAYERVLLWVSQGDYLALRMESYNASGTLEGTMEFRSLSEFEGNRIPATIHSTSPQDGIATTISISGTRRPDAALSVDFFDPSSLNELDPAAFGF